MSGGFFGSGRKKGSLRLLELLHDNLVNYFRSGMIALAGATVYGGAVWLASVSGSLLLTLLAGLLTGLLLGPTLCGLVDTVLRSLRDMPGTWWETYQRAWKQNTKQALLFGAVLGLILSGQIFALSFGLYPLITLISMAILTSVFVYIWPQIALVQLKNGVIVQNAVVLMLSHPGKTLLCVGVIGGWALLLWLLLPLSAILWAIAGMWLPTLLVLHILSDVLEDSFHAEAALSAAPEKKTDR